MSSNLAGPTNIMRQHIIPRWFLKVFFSLNRDSDKLLQHDKKIGKTWPTNIGSAVVENNIYGKMDIEEVLSIKKTVKRIVLSGRKKVSEKDKYGILVLLKSFLLRAKSTKGMAKEIAKEYAVNMVKDHGFMTHSITELTDFIYHGVNHDTIESGTIDESSQTFKNAKKLKWRIHHADENMLMGDRFAYVLYNKGKKNPLTRVCVVPLHKNVFVLVCRQHDVFVPSVNDINDAIKNNQIEIYWGLAIYDFRWTR